MFHAPFTNYDATGSAYNDFMRRIEEAEALQDRIEERASEILEETLTNPSDMVEDYYTEREDEVKAMLEQMAEQPLTEKAKKEAHNKLYDYAEAWAYRQAEKELS